MTPLLKIENKPRLSFKTRNVPGENWKQTDRNKIQYNKQTIEIIQSIKSRVPLFCNLNSESLKVRHFKPNFSHKMGYIKYNDNKC